MRRFLGIKQILGLPEPDNFIAKNRRCFKGVECVVGMARYKNKTEKNEQQVEDKILKASEFYS